MSDKEREWNATVSSIHPQGHKRSNSEIEVCGPLRGVVLVVELQAAVQTGFTAWLLLLPRENL